MASGVYLLKVSDEFTKVGRSDRIEQRLEWWGSHGLQPVWQQEMHHVDSVWLEYSFLRATLAPTEKQVRYFQRTNPMFPNNRHSLPSGSSEWRCVGADQAISMMNNYLGMVGHLSEHVPRTNGAQFHGLYWLRCQIAPADSRDGPMPEYKGPVPLLVNNQSL